MDPTPTVADMMAAYAQDAVDHAKAAAGVTLDYSPDSIKQVESVLETLYAAMPRGLGRLFRRGPTQEDVATMSKMYGGYIGETVISLRKGDQRIFPPDKVHKRLANGPEDNVWFYYQVLMKEHWK